MEHYGISGFAVWYSHGDGFRERERVGGALYCETSSSATDIDTACCNDNACNTGEMISVLQQLRLPTFYSRIVQDTVQSVIRRHLMYFCKLCMIIDKIACYKENHAIVLYTTFDVLARHIVY